MTLSEVTHILRTHHTHDIRKILAGWNDERLGKLIGDAEVFSSCRLDIGALTGRGVLMELAMQVVTAALADLVKEEIVVASPRTPLAIADDRRKSGRMFDEAARFMAHCKRNAGGHWYYKSVECEALRFVVGCSFSPAASREIMGRMAILRTNIGSWVPVEKELTLVLEVTEETNKPIQGPILETFTCGPSSR